MMDNAHETVVRAPAADLFDLIADVVHAPQLFPTHLHAEVVGEPHGAEDLIERWVIDGESVRGWRAHRTLDRDALRIVFQHEKAKPPLTLMRGEWLFRQDGETTTVRCTHTLDAPADAAAAVEQFLAGLDRVVPRQLSHLKMLGESLPQLRASTFGVELTGLVDLAVSDVYEKAVAGETSDDGSWRRVCLPAEKIVYKKVAGLGSPVQSLTGELRFESVASGARVVARRTVTLEPQAGPSVREVVAEQLAEEARGQLVALGATVTD